MLQIVAKIKAIIQYLRIFEYSLESHYFVQPTGSEKWEAILRWSLAYGGSVFIETGTWHGRTTYALAPHFERCFTIELDPQLARSAQELFRKFQNVTVLQGNSADVLPTILSDIEVRATFWLDAHYCGSGTAKGRHNTPILDELKVIFEHQVKDHLILLDDARAFIGIGGYPTIRRLARFVRTHAAHYEMIIQNDAIIIYSAEYGTISLT